MSGAIFSNDIRQTLDQFRRSVDHRAILLCRETWNVSLQGNQLVINGERKAPEGFNNNGSTHLTYGKFSTASCTMACWTSRSR